MKTFSLILFLLSCAILCPAQQKFSKEQLKEDADILYESILDVHPYMFTNIYRNEFEKELDERKKLLTDSMTAFDFYRLFAPLVSKIEDGHTELHYPLELAIRNEIEVLPYTFTIDKTDSTLMIRDGFEDKTLASGSRIMSVNGVRSKELIEKAFSMLSGEASHFKMERLNLLFSPLLGIILPSKEFQVEYVHNGEKESTMIRAKLLSEYVEVLLAPLVGQIPYSSQINRDQGTAVLSLNSFGIYDEKGKKEYRNFLDSLFREIAENHIENLIIDIRMNGGGLESLVWDLFQYISPEPFQTKGPSIEKIGEAVKKEYGLEEPTGIYVIGAEGLIPLRENPLRYSGNCYLLTSNFTFSSATDMAWAFQYFKMGKIVGEETGGLIVSYGNGFDVELPNTHLLCGISRWKYYGYGATEDQKHGVIPDLLVSAEEAMDAAMGIIRTLRL